MRRSTSPMPDVHKCLFHGATMLSPRPSGRKSSRPSHEDDFWREAAANVEKENLSELSLQTMKMRVKSMRSCEVNGERVQGRGLSARDTNTGSVFRFSVQECEAAPLRIYVQEDDEEVFTDPGQAGGSAALLLTPSTAHTPLLARTISQQTASPDIGRGLCCNTPNRERLEREGLGSEEKLVLGRGAYGTVVLGQWRGRKVAMKWLEREEGCRSARRRRSLESELHALELEHEHVVRVYGVHAADQRHAVIIMEYVGSRNLHSLLVVARERPLGSSWLLEAARQVSSALAHCHARRILHMDLKPANVLVTSKGVCKLGDFGCSVAADLVGDGEGQSGGRAWLLAGTPGYQAPELLLGLNPAPACDLYSLGVLLWQVDSREVPWAGHHPQAVMFRVVSTGARPAPPRPHIASIGLPSYTELYQSCWQAGAAKRPSAAGVAAALERLLEQRQRQRRQQQQQQQQRSRSLRC